MKIIAAKDFTLKDKKYKKGNEVKITSKEELIRLNERGFIKPLFFNDIQNYKFNNKKESETK